MAITMAKNSNLLLQIFQKYNHKVAIETTNRKITYSKLKKNSIELANFFKKKGLKKGDVVSVKLPNSLEFIYCYLACIFGGYKICPISNDLKNKDVKKIVKAVRSKYFIDNIKKIKFVRSKDINDIFFDENNTIGIFLTSGTSSLPKGICHNSKNIIRNAYEFNRKNKINKNSRLYHLFPMNYMAGFLNSIISPLVAGGTIIFKEKFNINFAVNFLKILDTNKINYLWVNPTMLKTINHFHNKSKKLNNKMSIFVGTSPLNINDKNRFYKLFSITPLESYGMTEILIFSSQKKEADSKKSNVGSMLNGCKIYNNKNKELIVKSPYINKYIYDLIKKSEKKINTNRFNTGDIGKLNSKKKLILLGRKKNIIIKGGQNIIPEGIEEKLNKLKFIKNACICPMKDKFYGEEVCLIVETVKKKELDIKLLENFIFKNLSKKEFPKKILHVKYIPKNRNFKILRNNLLSILFSNPKGILYEKNY